MIKRTKNQVSREASLRSPAPCAHCSRPLPCKPGRTTGCNYFALLRSHFPNASAKTCYAPAAAQATIVLPAFARSFPADGEEKMQEIKKEEARKAESGYQEL
ncbi:hypothetical protein [Mucilaginibacter angelicae]|uniref:hypothetical protein n=1 Tax=Mucilaginibacter angelicae TaxID=869718 RepID=UPI00366D8CA6